ncbi:KR domain-containing protein [Vibrio nigripulchritudo]|uniref:KR domain-containing protein n=1 Tax=Vibrio nigripulchritudo TaxID=28173 RepID=UPI0024905080|nr:KR domain-containing protein [Vibrio nigripulchritudo]BDU46847.1 hypothetical protein TUMSATVNIG3_56450 [Vibrio nigripulchritudo]
MAAEYLIDQGAKHLVLLSRRDIPESEWSEALLTLKGHARIESMVCDVSVEEEVSSLSDRLWQGDWYQRWRELFTPQVYSQTGH